MGFEQLVALKAQLNQGAKGKEVASRSTSQPVDVAREIKQPPKPRRTSADAAARAVTTLQRHFPQAFPRSPTPKVSLKVGILKDVLEKAASLGLSERDARNGVKLVSWPTLLDLVSSKALCAWTLLAQSLVQSPLPKQSTGQVRKRLGSHAGGSRLRRSELVGRVDRQDGRKSI
ncbi:ProQ/FINO family protein [Caballeronia sp. LZ028]|nr:ProQ/FINO family protein [Caballeronia sp. LZ028]MDR5769856.1 ProQ/FINO family protein [Caballeronia sp. LZ028]